MERGKGRRPASDPPEEDSKDIIEKILSLPTPAQTLLEDLLETNDRIVQKQITQIQLEMHAQKLKLIKEAVRQSEDFSQKNPSIPKESIKEAAIMYVRRETQKIKREPQTRIDALYKEKKAREENIRRFCADREQKQGSSGREKCTK